MTERGEAEARGMAKIHNRWKSNAMPLGGGS